MSWERAAWRRLGGLGICILGSLCAVSPAAAGTIKVTNKKDTGAGSLRQALIDSDTAAGPDLIKIKVHGVINLQSALGGFTTNGTTLKGPGADRLTIRRAAPESFRIFTINPGVTGASISGVTVSNGHAPTVGSEASGGGILNAGELTLSRVVVSGNSATNLGGGLGHSGSGGGIYNYPAATLLLKDSTVSDNKAKATGANTAARGGGVYNGNATMTVSNSTITGNRVTSDAGAEGGGLYSTGTLTVDNATIASNTGPGSNLFVVTGTVHVASTILAEPSVGQTNCSGVSAAMSDGFNLTSDTSCAFAQLTDLTGVAKPKLKPLADNGGPTPTMALKASSPAVDAGLGGVGLPKDQRGRPRFDFVAVMNASGGDGDDIGAYERQP